MEIRQISVEELGGGITEILDEHMDKEVGRTTEQTRRIAFAMYEGDKICGGILGTLILEGFHINELAISEEYRGQRYGEKLVKLAEDAAIEAGAKILTVSTQDYQALGFYEKLGYEVFGTLDDWPFKGTKKYYLTRKV